MKFLITESRLHRMAREAMHRNHHLCSSRKQLVDIDGIVKQTISFQSYFIELLDRVGAVEHLNETTLEKVVLGIFGRQLDGQIQLALSA